VVVSENAAAQSLATILSKKSIAMQPSDNTTLAQGHRTRVTKYS